MKAREITGILAALGTLIGGCIVALGGDSLAAGITSGFLIAAPATAVAVSLHRLDPPARIILALTAAVVVNAVVAEVMLVTDRWSIPGGVTAVAVISAGIWLAAVATSAWPATSADSRHGDTGYRDIRPGDIRPGDIRPGDIRPGDTANGNTGHADIVLVEKAGKGGSP